MYWTCFDARIREVILSDGIWFCCLIENEKIVKAIRPIAHGHNKRSMV